MTLFMPRGKVSGVIPNTLPPHVCLGYDGSRIVIGGN